jgi:phospholipid-binding lipoprotein MlaA
MYSFNNGLDKAILKPVAKTYHKKVPKPAKNGVHNFLSNLTEPFSIINNLLQGKVDRALSSTYRFTVNSTIGVLGLIDVASGYNVEKAPEDFGQTLAAWGVKPGPYLVLPLLGPSNLRDGISLSVSTVASAQSLIFDDTTAELSILALHAINSRARLLSADAVLTKQLDPYAFLKIAAEESRIDQLYDGNPPEKEEDFDF